jgi:putative transposase
MARRTKGRKQAAEQPTIWRVPDDVWEVVGPVIAQFDPPKATGRKRIDPRLALDTMIFRFRTGCHWNHFPAELGDDSSVHRTLQRWMALGIFEAIWGRLVEACDELGGVDWRWQSVDGSMGKARMGGDAVGPNPTDRAKSGSKKVSSWRPMEAHSP